MKDNGIGKESVLTVTLPKDVQDAAHAQGRRADDARLKAVSTIA